jgi:Phycobilisome protein
MILNLMTRLDGRYLKSTERNEIKAFLVTLRPRRAAYDEIRQKIPKIVDGLIVEMRKAYPEFAKIRPQGFEKGARDMGTLTRFAANMMMFESNDYYDHMFTEWYRTILKSVHMSPQFLHDTFRIWHAEMEKHLTGDTCSKLRPYTQHLSTYLTEIPVPIKDETGRRVAMKK